MLGKLIRHEFNTVARILLLIHSVIIFITIIECIGFNVAGFDIETSPIASIMFAIYFIFLIALSTATIIFLIVRFYKNLFTDEGYLTFTLPVKPYMIILSKLIVGFVWCLIDSLLCIISIFFVFKSLNLFTSDIFAEILDVINSLRINSEFDLTKLIIALVILFVVSILSLLLTSYVCISIGQLFPKHKILAAFTSYLGLYMFNQIIGSITFYLCGVFDILPALYVSEECSNGIAGYTYFLTTANISNIESIVMCVIYFFVINYIISKRLNLD